MNEPVFGVRNQGSLLDLELDLSREMGIAHERCLRFRKGEHAHERVVICAARGSTRAEIREAGTGKITLNHAGVVVVKPPLYRHSVRSLTAVYDDIALLPTASWVKATGRDCGFSEVEIGAFLAECRQIARSPWLDQLLERYFSRRCVLRNSSGAELEFFEREILRELLTLAGTNLPKKNEASPPSLRKAIEIIETNLFSPPSLAELGKAVGLSRSSLLRLFATALGTTPPAYIRMRRLDEAAALLAKGAHGVAEVAALVGYRDASAFSRAFRRRFGKAPKRG